jgi:hypothetical protein
LDQVGGGSTGPKMGHGRRKDQRNNPRTQVEARDNTNPRACLRDIGYEEAIGRTHNCAKA